MFEIYDTLTKQTFSKDSTGQLIASEMKFTTPAKGFLIDMHGKVWLHFQGGTTLCLTCHHPARTVAVVVPSPA